MLVDCSEVRIVATVKSDQITNGFLAYVASISWRDVVAGLAWKPAQARAGEARQVHMTADLWAGGLAIPKQHFMDQSPKSAVQDQILPIGWDEDGADRWPIAYSVVFVVGVSALLWASIIGAVNWFIG